MGMLAVAHLALRWTHVDVKDWVGEKAENSMLVLTSPLAQLAQPGTVKL